MRKICVINQKGGVGKTTTTINLGAGLSRKNRRVLLIDLDPQGNIATSLGDAPQKNVYDFLIDNADIRECTRNLGQNFDIVTSNESLTRAEAEILMMQNKETLLKRKLNEGAEALNYDYILIDCPPSIGVLTQNAILACGEAIIPVSCDFLGYTGLKSIVSLINFMCERYDHDITVSKIIPTMYDLRSNVSKQTLVEIKNDFYEIVSDPIRVNSKLREAPKHKQSIFRFAKNSRGSKDYTRLCNQIMYDERRFKIRDAEQVEEVEEIEEPPKKRGRKKGTTKAKTKLKSKNGKKATA